MKDTSQDDEPWLFLCLLTSFGYCLEYRRPLVIEGIMGENREGFEESMQSVPSGTPEAKSQPRQKRWDAKTRLLALCVVVAVGWVVIWGPIGLGVKPSNPRFCNLWCHNM